MIPEYEEDIPGKCRRNVLVKTCLPTMPHILKVLLRRVETYGVAQFGDLVVLKRWKYSNILRFLVSTFIEYITFYGRTSYPGKTGGVQVDKKYFKMTTEYLLLCSMIQSAFASRDVSIVKNR